MKTLVTGATGLIGTHLLPHLEDVVVLSRNAARAREQLAWHSSLSVHGWDAEKEPAPADAFRGVDAVIHLAGEPVADGRWSEERQRRIRDSRVIGTRHLVDTLLSLSQAPKVLVSGSAVGIYGDRADETLDEDSPLGRDFLADVCAGWEREALRAEQAGLRVVTVRTGVVLSADGGALAKMLTPFKMGVGGRLGHGRQWMPWIHIADEVGLLLHAATHDTVTGPMNAVSPNPARNADFTKTLAGVLRRPAVFPVPALALKTLFGDMSQVLLASQRVAPKVARDTGYTFQFPELSVALGDCLRAQGTKAA